MPTVLTDADIAKLDAKPLTDADIAEHDAVPKDQPQPRGALGEAWEGLKGLARGVVSIPSFMAQLSKLSPLSAEGDQLGKAKEMFVDPVVQQHEKAALDFAAGNTISGLTRATLGSVPVVGPGIITQAERIQDPATRSGAIGETIGAAVAPEIPGMVRATPAVAARGVRAVGNAVTAPGVAQIIGGTGELVAGGAGLVSGHPAGMILGAGSAARGATRIAEGLAKNRAVPAPLPPGLTPAEIGKLPVKQAFEYLQGERNGANGATPAAPIPRVGGVKQVALDAKALSDKLAVWKMTPDEVRGMNNAGWAKLAHESGVPMPTIAVQDRAVFNRIKDMVAKEGSLSDLATKLRNSLKAGAPAL